jgi:hypothetical protein
MKLKETARRIWRYFEAIADVAEYDPLTEITARVERLERAVADLGNLPGLGRWRGNDHITREPATRRHADSAAALALPAGRGQRGWASPPSNPVAAGRNLGCAQVLHFVPALRVQPAAHAGFWFASRLALMPPGLPFVHVLPCQQLATAEPLSLVRPD